MNTKNIAVFVLMVMVLSANAFSIINRNNQDNNTLTVVGTFDGYDEDEGYMFIIEVDDEEDGEETIYFTEISNEALKAVNLKSDEMIGKRFEITYEVTEFEVEDENGYVETFEKLKITQIKKL